MSALKLHHPHWLTRESVSLAAWSAKKIGGKFTLQHGMAIVLSMIGTAILCRAAGEHGWLAASFLMAGMALFIALRREADLHSQGLLEKLSESLPGMVYQCRLDPTGRCAITYANDAIRWIYEKEYSEVRHDCSSIMDLVHPDDRERIRKSLLQSARHLTPWREEYRVVLPRQGTCWHFAQAHVERVADGSTLWHGFVADITARKEADARLFAAERREVDVLRAANNAEQKKVELLSRLNKNLREESTHDHLTGVFLRRHFDRQFPKVLERSQLKRPITLILCDVDHFKMYNDTFGHAAGDQCLRAIARALASEVNRRGQILARYGGEEFVALLPGLGSSRAAFVADQMRWAVEVLGMRGPGGENDLVTISVGLACMDIVSADIPEDLLLRAADEALYEAKEAGRNCVRQRLLDATAIRDSRLPDSAARAPLPHAVEKLATACR